MQENPGLIREKETGDETIEAVGSKTVQLGTEVRNLDDDLEGDPQATTEEHLAIEGLKTEINSVARELTDAIQETGDKESPAPSSATPEAEGRGSLIDRARVVADALAQQEFSPRVYASLEDALSEKGLSQKGRLERNNSGTPYLADAETGKKKKYLMGLASDLLTMQNGLAKASMELRTKNDSPVLLVQYDLSERYGIATAIGQSVDRGQIGMDGASGHTEALLVFDKQTGQYHDIQNIVAELPDQVTVANPQDLMAIRTKTTHGASGADHVSYRLITSAAGLATYFHEIGHAALRKSWQATLGEEDTAQFYNSILDARLNTGNYPAAEAREAMLVDETGASAVGNKMASAVFEDASFLAQVTTKLDEISARYEEQLTRAV